MPNQESFSHLKHSSFVEKLRTLSLAAVTGQREEGQHEVACELTMRDVSKLLRVRVRVS